MAFDWNDVAVRKALGMRTDFARDELAYAGVSTDSRTVSEGDLYVALVGDRFDGHDFVADAFAKGAAGAVVSKPSAGDPAGTFYPVDDTLDALGRLAAWRRKKIDAPVVAITGSSGKTTTKEMTRAALSETYRVHATSGNLNNRIGMPLTILSMPDDVEAVVLELGTNEPGEIEALVKVARPNIAVVTTVGESHLEKLESFDGVLAEKLDILRGMADGGRCVVGDDPPVLAERAHAICSSVKVVGWSEFADQDARPGNTEVDVFGRYSFEWCGQRVTAPTAGKHAVANALLSLVVASLLNVPARDAIRGLSSAKVGPMRGEFQRIGDLTVIVDCYNANPQSVRASLDVLENQAVTGCKVAVLGSMLELGDASAELHTEVFKDVIARDIDLIVATGHFAEAAAKANLSEERMVVGEDWEAVYSRLIGRLNGGEIILLKASRGIALERILTRLEEDFGHAIPEVEA